MPQSACPYCNAYIQVPNVGDRDLDVCPYCNRPLLLYKCFSCMKVTAFRPNLLPAACPKCFTIIRTAAPLPLQVPPVVVPPPQFQVYLHNDNPLATGTTNGTILNRLVFRGSRVGYAAVPPAGFTAAADARFNQPYIIRDSWVARQVMTYMQTKAVLAWSKNIFKALQYAEGCISGQMGVITPGFLYVAWVDVGVDVLAAVREWERSQGWGQIPAGTQDEVLSPTLPVAKVIGCWTIVKGPAFGTIRISGRAAIATDAFPGGIVNRYNDLVSDFPLDTDINVYPDG